MNMDTICKGVAEVLHPNWEEQFLHKPTFGTTIPNANSTTNLIVSSSETLVTLLN